MPEVSQPPERKILKYVDGDVHSHGTQRKRGHFDPKSCVGREKVFWLILGHCDVGDESGKCLWQQNPFLGCIFAPSSDFIKSL